MATVYKSAIRATLKNGVVLVNTPHYEDETDGSAQSVADGIWAQISSTYLALFATGDTVNDITVTQVPVSSTPIAAPKQYVKAIGSAGGRTVTTPNISPAMCAQFNLTTGVAGRRARGRIFCPPALIATELATIDNFTTGAGTYYQKCLDFLNALTGSYASGIQLVVYSRVAALANATNTWFHVTGFNGTAKQHWLRSRDMPGP
jgi:hypothetical protein